jgi:hypothetical protein
LSMERSLFFLSLRDRIGGFHNLLRKNPSSYSHCWGGAPPLNTSPKSESLCLTLLARIQMMLSGILWARSLLSYIIVTSPIDTLWFDSDVC